MGIRKISSNGQTLPSRENPTMTAASLDSQTTSNGPIATPLLGR